MTSLFLLLPISLLLVVLIGVAFWWAIFSGQFDNTQQAAESILHDNDSVPDASAQAPSSVTPGKRASHRKDGHA